MIVPGAGAGTGVGSANPARPKVGGSSTCPRLRRDAAGVGPGPADPRRRRPGLPRRPGHGPIAGGAAGPRVRPRPARELAGPRHGSMARPSSWPMTAGRVRRLGLKQGPVPRLNVRGREDARQGDRRRPRLDGRGRDRRDGRSAGPRLVRSRPEPRRCLAAGVPRPVGAPVTAGGSWLRLRRRRRRPGPRPRRAASLVGQARRRGGRAAGRPGRDAWMLDRSGAPRTAGRSRTEPHAGDCRPGHPSLRRHADGGSAHIRPRRAAARSRASRGSRIRLANREPGGNSLEP